MHVKRLGIKPGLRYNWIKLIEEAFKADWNPIRDYNGCSVVQDQFHPCPACFCHDYMWITSRGGKMSDEIFYHLMIAEGMDKKKAKRRYLGVRLAWCFYYRWKYSLKNPTKAMLRLNNYING